MARKRYAARHPHRVTNAVWANAISRVTGRRIKPGTISEWEAGTHEPQGGALLAALWLAGVDLEGLLQPSASDHLANLRRLIDDNPSPESGA